MKLKEKLWNWGHLEGSHKDCTLLDCKMSPEQFAQEYSVQNAFIVSYGGNIQPPFDSFAERFSGLREVKWSVLGDSSTRYLMRNSAIQMTFWLYLTKVKISRVVSWMTFSRRSE
jgi:hypothetical protein